MTMSDGMMFVAQEKGYFAKQGLSVEVIPFATANDVVPAVATGQIAAGTVAPNAAFFNAEGRGTGIKLVADKGSLYPGMDYLRIIVRDRTNGAMGSVTVPLRREPRS
ncbi:MAG: ABC transporter substrate-binding protein [Acidobacteria bacterium]|nr:ABC transporter substrate-binding protein [Acidobacteriota bacterium]